ncbi:MAG TPA: glycosyltransferase family 4 protein [Tepidisphaeraceae bacterium]|jgi:glycosyltransferase involved in cell wall biosynthesis|nr:glycosyltransferase family 4 protein [Tepidisphaeraceae bacterium]
MYTPTAGGGHARYAWELLNALSEQQRGYRFELVSSEDLDPQFHPVNYRLHAILPALKDRRDFPNRAAWVASRLTHYARRDLQFLKWLKSRPDVVAVHFQEWTPWQAAPLFRRIRAMGKKIFYTNHNVVPHKYPKFIPKQIVDGWTRRACLQADGLFVLSDLLADQLSRFLGDDHPPIRVVPHGVWTVADMEKAPGLDERLGWKRLLSFGTLRKNKGVDLLLRAAEYLPGYSITIAGEPIHSDYFHDEILPLVRQLRARGVKVDLIDHFVPDEQVGALFASHSAIVLPYTRDFVAQSGVAFMALAYQLPVVASEAGGLRDLFDEFKIGVTFRDPTPQALAQAVKELYSQDARRDLVRQIAAARDRYSWHQAARATMAGYALEEEKVRHAEDCPIAATATP